MKVLDITRQESKMVYKEIVIDGYKIKMIFLPESNRQIINRVQDMLVKSYSQVSLTS